MTPTESRTVYDYLALAYRYKGRALAVLLGVLLLSVAWFQFAPRVYESEAKLLVRIGRENAALDPTMTKSETISLNSNREEEMNSIVEHIRSRGVLEKTLALYDPVSDQASPEEREKVVRGLSNNISIFSPRMSTVVTVQGRAASPEVAQRMVATLVKVYLDDHMRIYRNSSVYDFFHEQTALLKTQLDAAQAALQNVKNQAGLASLEGRRTSLEGQVSALETQIQQVQAQEAASATKLKTLEEAVRALPAPLMRQMLTGMPHDGLAAMEDQLFQLRIREQEALSKYAADHPKAVALHSQVAAVEAALKQETPDPDQVLAAVTATSAAELASLRVQKEKLQAELTSLMAQLVALNEAEVKVAQYTRDVRQLENEYLAYAEKREQARMDQAMKTDRLTNVSILQEATFVPRPIRPQKSMVLALGLLGGGLGAVVVILFFDFRQRVHTGAFRHPETSALNEPGIPLRTPHSRTVAEGSREPAHAQSNAP